MGLSYYERNKEKILEKRKEYYKQNSDLIKARTKTHREKVGDQHRDGYFLEYQRQNREKCRAADQRWRDSHREERRAAWRLFNKTHPQYRAYMTAQRRAYKLQATPPWLTDDHRTQILEIYQSCPKGFEVDHTIPLKGKSVSGLHVPWNLRVIPATENRKKSNRL